MTKKIDLALEIPTSLLADLSEETDLDFALSFQALRDPEYARFYRNRPAGRELILDNGTHELGHPLPVDKILQAAKLIHPDYIVAPDLEDYPEWTVEQAWEMYRALEKSGLDKTAGLATCLSGRNFFERSAMLAACPPLDMLCFPYDRPRLEWFLERHTGGRKSIPRIHLFGVSELWELDAWADILSLPALSEVRVSVDTAKPVKWGLLGRKINDGKTLRHAPIPSADLFQVPRPPDETIDLIRLNIRLLQNHTNLHCSKFLSRETDA